MPRKLCVEGRKKELDYFQSKDVWEMRTVKEAVAKTGEKPISVRWVETNKGDDANPNVRSRLVAREIRMAGQEAIFAPTPPLESLRMVLSYAVTNFSGEKIKEYGEDSEERMQVMLIDISRAYFNAKIGADDDPVYVDFPPELNAPAGMCGRLRRHMYGTRRAADGWQDEYSSSLKEAGFVQGLASPCVFRHPARRIVLSVHGDDFTDAGPKSQLDWLEATLRGRYELTTGGRLGPGKEDTKEATILIG